MGVNIVTGSRYLGGFVVDGAAQESLLDEKVQGWAESVKTLAVLARNHLQSAYAGLQKSLQQEWAFVKRVTPIIGDAFVPVEEALQATFVPSLFQVLGEEAQGRGVT